MVPKGAAPLLSEEKKGFETQRRKHEEKRKSERRGEKESQRIIKRGQEFRQVLKMCHQKHKKI